MVFGNASAWSTGLRNVHEEVIDSILRVWPLVASRFTTDDKEDDITDRLVVEMRRDGIVRDKWRVEREYQLLPENEKGEIPEKPSIDMVVLFTLQQSVYLAYECKRLRVTFPSGFQHLADRYVEEGMMRFLVGKYAPGLLFGTMLGYVMDSNVDSAVQNVRDAIYQREVALRCNKTVETLSAAGVMMRMRTIHNIKKLGESPFTMHHGLLPLVLSSVPDGHRQRIPE